MMAEQHCEEMTELQDIMFAMEQNINDREADAKSDFQSTRDEIKNKVCFHSVATSQKCGSLEELPRIASEESGMPWRPAAANCCSIA